jgi:hypothetical protein
MGNIEGENRFFKKNAAMKSVFFVIFLAIGCPIFGQAYIDTLCFTISLSADTNNLLWCGRSDDMRSVLAGPVLMENGSLLFYSCNGYALYNPSGELIDSHSVFKENRKLSPSDRRRMALAYPLDQKTVIYYRRDGDSLEIYEKKISKRGLSRISTALYSNFRDIETSRLFNLAQNGFTDELAPKSFIKSNLIGYTSLTAGRNWWSLDKFYSFLSPVIVMQGNGFFSFFPGMLSDQKIEIQKHLINPLGVFAWDDRLYYYGVHSATGSTTPQCNQKLYLCDHAGNLLMTTDFLKQVIVDDVLAYDKKRNTNYTVKRPWQFVFSPAIDGNGDAYFGLIDFKARTLEVNKRLFFHYTPQISEASPENEDLIRTQRKFVIMPGLLQFKNASIDGYSQTGFLVRNEQGKHRRAELKDVACRGFSVSSERDANPELAKKLTQGTGSLPAVVKHVRDSLARLQNTHRPCTITLRYNERDKVREFYFSPCEEVITARVINVSGKGEVFVRVDLKDRAEIVVFSQAGVFINRFTFNRQDVKKRKDIIAATENGMIVEEDYERIKEDYTYMKWELKTSPAINAFIAAESKGSKS